MLLEGLVPWTFLGPYQAMVKWAVDSTWMNKDIRNHNLEEFYHIVTRELAILCIQCFSLNNDSKSDHNKQHSVTGDL
jgi:hypothetical protein